MALKQVTKKRVIKALASTSAGNEVVAAIDANTAKVATVIAAIATADATDLASAVALSNANKAKINALIAALKAAGLMASA